MVEKFKKFMEVLNSFRVFTQDEDGKYKFLIVVGNATNNA